MSRTLIIASTMLMLLPAVAGARTLAVLPLEQGAGSEQFAGLGTALAGMLVSDLSRSEQLQLVERSRLDDLLGEIALGEGDFLDPSTAQQLGQGLGAELVVTGSYSVVGETFLLDARVIEVQSAAVLKAVDASGSIEDFVVVEKDLVEALLDGLAVEMSSSDRRKLLIETPTESFQAFAAYGQGLDHEAQGRVDEARAAFESALQIDPQFVEAREAIASMRVVVQTERDRVQQNAADRKSMLRQRVLDAVPDERTREDGFRDDASTLAQFGLRLMVLQDLERDCQVYEEQWHYLERVDWDVHQPPKKGGHDLFETTMLQAIEWELIEHPGRLRTIPFDDPDVADMPALFYNTPRYVLDLSAASHVDPKGHGMIYSIQNCFTPAEQLGELQRLLDRAEEVGAADTVHSPDHWPGVTLGDHLESIWTLTHAKYFGANAEVQARAEAILAKMDNETSRGWATHRVEQVVFWGDLWERTQILRLGMDDNTIRSLTQALAEGQGGPIRWDDERCSAAAGYAQPVADWNWKRYQTLVEEGEDDRAAEHIGSIGYLWGGVRDMGCVQGHPGRVADAFEAYAFVATSTDRLREDHAGDDKCVELLDRLDQQTDPTNLGYLTDNLPMLVQMEKTVLDWYYAGLVLNRCVEDVR